MNAPETAPEIPWWKQKLIDLFAIDPRSLAAFRIGFALVLLYDLVDRVFDLEAMILDRGILSVADARTHGNLMDWSLYFLSSADWYQSLLFGLTFVSCVMMLLGCFTRVATVCTWILVVSLHARMPLVLSSGDAWMRVMLFWAMFLPLGRVWSIDARRAGKSLAARCRPVLSFAAAAALLQIAVVYFFAGLAKWNDVWLSGNAMHYVFDQLIFLRPLGKQLLEYPAILRVLSHATLALEIGAPLLLFFPWATKYVRLGIVLLVFAFHLGIELTLNVGHFSYIAFASWALFLPAMFWDSALFAKMWPRRKRSKAIAEAEQRQTVPSTPIRLVKGSVAAVCVGTLIIMLAWNVSWIVDDRAGKSVRDAAEEIAAATKMKQRWKMFGKPFSVDTWYVYRAQLADGSIVDLIRNGNPPSDKRPTTTAPVFRNHRWKKMHNRMATESTFDPKRLDRYRHQIAEYVCEQWNRTHGEDKQIVKVVVLCFGTQIGPGAVAGEYSRATFATLTFAEPEEASVFQEEFLRLERGEAGFSAKY